MLLPLTSALRPQLVHAKDNPLGPGCQNAPWRDGNLQGSWSFFLAGNIPKKKVGQTDSSAKAFGFSGWYIFWNTIDIESRDYQLLLKGLCPVKVGFSKSKWWMFNQQFALACSLSSWFLYWKATPLYNPVWMLHVFPLFVLADMNIVGLVFREKLPRKYRALRKPWICFTPKHTSFLKTVLHSILGEMILAPHPPRHALPHAMIRFKGGDHHGPAGGGKVSTKTLGPNFIGKNEELTWILHNQQECGYDPTKLGICMVAKFKVFGTANGLIILSRLCKNIASRLWRITLLWPRPIWECVWMRQTHLPLKIQKVQCNPVSMGRACTSTVPEKMNEICQIMSDLWSLSPFWCFPMMFPGCCSCRVDPGASHGPLWSRARELVSSASWKTIVPSFLGPKEVAISLMFGHKVGKTLEGLEFDPGKIGQCWFLGIFWVSWTSWFKAYVQHEI